MNSYSHNASISWNNGAVNAHPQGNRERERLKA